MTKNILLLGSLALVFTGCSKFVSPIATPAEAVTYTVTESFENASNKTAYALANITSPTGTWALNDALVGNLPTDLKNGTKSVRLRAGTLSMNFDVSGMKMLYISHGKFGTDAGSTWQLLISADGGKTYTQVGTDIVENNTVLKLDSFAVNTTGPVRFQIKKAGTTRVNFDDITFRGTGDPGIVAGTPDTAPVDTTSTGNVAAARGITAGADAQPVSGDNSNALFGNPSGASAVTPDNYLLDQSYYVESYSSSRGTPNWVSWHLDASNSSNATGRLDNFAAFNGLPAGAFQVQSNSYSGTGFDRGHNTPSADRTSSANANSATFLMTNMIPQAPNNNQKAWATMENDLRAIALQGNEVYIIMGSYGSGGVGSASAATITTIANGKVTVPSNVWKVAVIIPVGDGDVSRVSATTRVIAVNTPNMNSIGADWKAYRVTVRDIEKATGYNLLSSLPQNVQDAIETKVDKL
jgi:endonuclease G